MSQTEKLHSAEYFGESRDYWWNADFLRLMAQRWDLSGVRNALDVGCGVGHWGRLLSPLLPGDATVVGVDREQAWVTKAAAVAAERGLTPRHSYIQGNADALPFRDAAFDLVTCQTVLMHVRDPRRVLSEMRRVLRPGGLIIASEPNNLADALVRDSVTMRESVEEMLALFRFLLLCLKGKEAIGEGNSSIGDLVPGMLLELGFESIQAYQSDKASLILPPYSRNEEKANIGECLAWAGREFWWWDREDTLRYFLGGGGASAEFERLWAMARGERRALADAMRAGTYTSAGGHVSYLISARRPKTGS